MTIEWGLFMFGYGLGIWSGLWLVHLSGSPKRSKYDSMTNDELEAEFMKEYGRNT